MLQDSDYDVESDHDQLNTRSPLCDGCDERSTIRNLWADTPYGNGWTRKVFLAATAASFLGGCCLLTWMVVFKRHDMDSLSKDSEMMSAVGDVDAYSKILEEAAPEGCSVGEKDIDYVYEGGWASHLDNVASQEGCCALCHHESKCKAWTWVVDAKLPSGNPGQCWMKGGVQNKTKKVGVYSGLSPKGPKGNHLDIKTEDVAKRQEDENSEKCAAVGESCQKSKCCKNPGMQCFTKNDYWAQCMDTCNKGPNPLDQVSNMAWECKALGPVAPGTPKTCAKAGEDCSESKCCLTGGTQCFAKNNTWAECKPSCEPGADLMSSDWHPWSCKVLGPKALGAAPWTATSCAQPGADCSKIMCCATPGHQCYLQSQYWGECKETCVPGSSNYPGGPTWACTPAGMRTPLLATDSTSKHGVVGKWVAERCAGVYEDCSKAECCTGVSKQCYTRGEGKPAKCKETCSTDPDPTTNETWECGKLGPRSWGLALKGFPSLFCVSLYMPSRYEGPMLKAHLKADAGIFACDGYDVFSADEDTLGTSKDGHVVKANLIPKIDVGVSQDGTAGNAKLFMAFWDKVIAAGRFRDFDFTIKVDPDAVIIPWRIRDHMKPHVGANAYVVNCNKFPNSPNFPMMFGAVEIFSNKAMTAYAYGSWKCGQQLPWHAWGEDYYMTHCLDFLGVGRIADFGTLGDNVCTGANCKDDYTGSFHPFKDQDSWFQCWNDATGR